MAVKMVEKMYVEKDWLIEDFNAFFKKGDSSSAIGKMLNDTFEKLKQYLDKRFVRMNDGYCFDKKVTACWLGLCEDDFSYMGKFYGSGTDLDTVLKEMREFYKNDKIDLPSKNELLALTELDNAPFSINSGRPDEPSSYALYSLVRIALSAGRPYESSEPSSYMLYKENTIVRGFNTDRGYLKDISYGRPYPIYRLHIEGFPEIDDRVIFLLWITHKLKPIGFEDSFYDVLLESDLNGLEVSDISRIFPSSVIDSETIIEELRRADRIRADLIEYDRKIFTDINKGSWEVFERGGETAFEEPVEVGLSKPLVARDPKDDIVDGIIGIDFGTKSTVVVYSKDKEKSLPMRVGIGDWSKKEEAKHYENPTVMEFLDLETFLSDYRAKEFRPYTKWEDLTISHTAYSNLKESHSKNFNAYLTELKQWAGDKKREIKIEDYKGRVFELPTFVELEDEDLNPIELYAYYLGLYINNQFNGIYLDYILSFPVTYEMEVRQKILQSFKKGLRKSLPNIGDRIDDLNVVSGVSEPAAYAAVALQHYGFGEQERSFYGIFDFGGGTTDFDFGIFRFSDETNRKERRYDYVIEHFGAGGDKFLGGENLLELLAFELFKKSKEQLLKMNVSFVLPPECDEFLGSEMLLSNSREAKLNMVNLIGKLREFWERDGFEEEIFNGEVLVDLYDNSGEKLPSVRLEVDESELFEILRYRIKKGVDSFFESLREAFFNNSDEIDLDIDTINIFLAGNSSKSPIVKELFDKKIEEIKKEMREGLNGGSYSGDFKLFLPIDNSGDFAKPNGKTGVAFGLIETRPGGNGILVIDRNIKKDNIKFKYYLGMNRRKRFSVIVDREVEYNKWIEFIDAGVEFFEVYYTSSPLATTKNLSISDASVKRKRLKIDRVDDEMSVYLRVVTPSSFEYAVGDGKEFFDAKRVELSGE